MLNKIFISIASYRDPLVLTTINSAIENADNPDNISFGLVIQDLDRDIPNFEKYKNISIIKMHPRDAMGAGFARSKAMSLLKDEDFFLQIDSHTVFEKSWDTNAIKELKYAQELSSNKKVILSYFPPPFHIESGNKIFIIKNNKMQPPYPTRQRPKLNKRKEWTAERFDFEDKNKPELSTTVLAGFIFAESNLIKEVPYDPEISFFGEEICFAIRAWTRGWDIYSPSKIILYHFYTRGGYSKIWKDRNIRKISWKEVEEISKQKQKMVLCGIQKGIYGAGNIRSLKEYEELIGINFKTHYGFDNEDRK
jgi:hypothetical protein